MYLRLIRYGCDIVERKFVSFYLASSPGNFSVILLWPFQSTIEVSCNNQHESAAKRTQKIIPSKHNSICFQRPTSKSSKMTLGLVKFMSHRFVQKFVPFFHVLKISRAALKKRKNFHLKSAKNQIVAVVSFLANFLALVCSSHRMRKKTVSTLKFASKGSNNDFLQLGRNYAFF